MGIGQLHALVTTLEQAWGRYLARADSTPGFLDGYPVLVPVAGPAVISTPFGQAHDPFTGATKEHNGVDIVAPRGVPVLAAAGGTVTDVRDDLRWGLTVRLAHDQGFATVYAHLGSVTVKRGSRLRKGDTLGTLGASGLATGPHLHYEVHRNGVPLDPQALFYPSQDSQLTSATMAGAAR